MKYLIHIANLSALTLSKLSDNESFVKNVVHQSGWMVIEDINEMFYTPKRLMLSAEEIVDNDGKVIKQNRCGLNLDLSKVGIHIRLCTIRRTMFNSNDTMSNVFFAKGLCGNINNLVCDIVIPPFKESYLENLEENLKLFKQD